MVAANSPSSVVWNVTEIMRTSPVATIESPKLTEKLVVSDRANSRMRSNPSSTFDSLNVNVLEASVNVRSNVPERGRRSASGTIPAPRTSIGTLGLEGSSVSRTRFPMA